MAQKKKDYMDDHLYKRAIEKAQSKGERKPDQVFLQAFIPFDCYETFIRRYYSDPDYKFRLTQNKVTKKDIISHLLWAWGAKMSVNVKDNIFDQIDPMLVKEVRHGSKKPREGSRPMGRPPRKHLIGLFDQGIPQENQKSKSKGEEQVESK